MSTDFVPTSVARRLVARMQATHDRALIAVFSGPPGIGKTTAIEEFRDRNPAAVVILKVEMLHAREALVLQHLLTGLRQLTGSKLKNTAVSSWWLRDEIFRTLELRQQLMEAQDERKPRLTIVFDEAQTLSRQAIEALRYWNDRDRCYAPIPIGFVFVGNDEFALAGNADGRSVISAAVADRAAYLEALEYPDLTDDDLRLITTRWLDAEPVIHGAIVRHFSRRGVSRSLRRVRDLVEELRGVADGARVNEGHLQEVLGFWS